MTEHAQAAYTGPSPPTGYVGFINIMKTDDGVRFSVRSEGEVPNSAQYEIPQDHAVKLLEGALLNLTGRPAGLSPAQIKHMVDRFLGWKLPENFQPDAGISFKPTFNDDQPFGPMRHNPSGTNLFDATQAAEMVRFMTEGLPD